MRWPSGPFWASGASSGSTASALLATRVTTASVNIPDRLLKAITVSASILPVLTTMPKAAWATPSSSPLVTSGSEEPRL